MGPAGRQFQALLWKNGLSRLRHPVLSLAEFLWPCSLFLILTVLRFQEPPRHKDSCFLRPRDLPSRGVLPFVRGLLCNTGSTCRNFSFEESADYHFRVQAAAGHEKVDSLAFLEELQDLAEDIDATMDMAEHVRQLWGERGEPPDDICTSLSTSQLAATLAGSLQDSWLSRNPIATLLRDLTVTEEVKGKDLTEGITEFDRKLRATVHLPDEAVGSSLQDGLSPSEPPIPSEAGGLLTSLPDVVFRLHSLLARAQHVREHLPEFLHAFEITALLDVLDVSQASQNGQARSWAFGSFQSLMKMVCDDEVPFFSNSHPFLSLPGAKELLEEDKEKLHIPPDSTPFCLKLYQEILQFPNGALVWFFLKPILHGKILYTPNTPEINEVIQKANYTFHVVHKFKMLSETLLRMSRFFQGSGSGQPLGQLQDILRNKFIRKLIESQLHVNVDTLVDTLQTYGTMLDKVLNSTGAGGIRLLGGLLVNLSSCVVLDRFQAVESEGGLEAEAGKLAQQNQLLAAVIFNSSSIGKSLPQAPPRLPPHVTYTIRASVVYSMRTDQLQSPSWTLHPQSLPADGFKYNYVFVPLQDMIERAIIAVQTGQQDLEPTTQAQGAPYPCHTSDLFLSNVGFFFPLIMTLAWVVSVASMVRQLVQEREIHMAEYLWMLGVHPTLHFLAWFLENVAMLAVSSAALATILKTSGVFAHSNAAITFLFLLDFGVSAVTLSYLLSAFFSQANMAALCASLVYLVTFLPYVVLLVLRNQLSPVAQTLLCLLTTTAFGQGVHLMTLQEGQEAGVQWDNVGQAPEAGGLTFSCVCWMMLLDSSLYFFCGWYLSNLIPGTFGWRKPWHFPLLASYWRSVCSPVGRQKRSLQSTWFFLNKDSGGEGSVQRNRDGEPERGPPGVTLMSVTKELQGHKGAVRDLTLTFYRGQITALLGANGAGKTTVISMLTGLSPPTSGTILVHGRNLQAEPPSIRGEVGVCLQQDVLLGCLTVREHLQLFASIKVPQWTSQELQQHVCRTLKDVGLTRYQHTAAHALSGGVKRKLSIAIAFLGSSKTVVLDEPTSGVDPCSRRSLWDILLKYREGRTIIFTTHHLDEAEALGDRVAVLQRGRLLCCSTLSRLKEAHGQGLRLTLTRQPSVLETDGVQAVARLTSLLQVYIPQASLRGSHGAEVTYAIPRDADKARLTGLLQALEQDLQPLCLESYWLSDPTLEEVFLMLLQDSTKSPHSAPDADLEPQAWRPAGPSAGGCGAAAGTFPPCALPGPIRGRQLLLEHVAALLRKRLLRTLRGWKNSVSGLLLPVLFVALAVGLFMVQPLATHYPPLRMTPGHGERAETSFFSVGTNGDDRGLTRVLLRDFASQDPVCTDFDPDGADPACWHRDPASHLELQDSCGCLKCPNRSAGPPYLTNRWGHTLFNLSGFPVEEELLVPSEKMRLGGWSFGVGVPGGTRNANASTSKTRTLAKVWYHQKSFHSLPAYLNRLNNLLLWRHLPPAQDWRQYGITLYSHPYGGALLKDSRILESIRQFGVALCIVLGFSILSAFLGSTVVRDRVTGAKRLQHLSGLGYRTYWVTHFLYDMVFYLVSVCLCIAVILASQLRAFTFRQNLAATSLLLAFFGYATLPWMYLMSGVFPSADAAFLSYVSLNFVCGLGTLLMTTMPQLLAIVSKAQHLQHIHAVLKGVFAAFPPFCLGQGLIELCYSQIKYDLTLGAGLDAYVSPFEMHLLGWVLMALALEGTVLLLLRLLLHGDLLRRPRGPSPAQRKVQAPEDADIRKEQARVSEGPASGDILVLRNLRKTYGSFFRKTAVVHGVSLGVPRAECFGLLGVNGAGKSTVFKMLSGDVSPSSGCAAVRTPRGDYVDLTSAGKANVLVGYCPQQDALDELLTGWEHLRYYCSLRGILKQHVPEVAADLVRRLHLEAHADKLVATYSGGTKRKLSTALALVGQPDILLLDEPSSGMDPCSKRYLWQTITKEVRRGCAVVLTSHSMEECEAVCTRLAIMVDGSFRCLGSPQHIKNRFGDGYTVKVWLHQEGNQPSTLSSCLKCHFPEIQFKGQRLNLLEYSVPKRWGCFADLFQVLENNKTVWNIEHYSVSPATLEQVFMNFATESQQAPRSALGPSQDGTPQYQVLA